MKKLHQLLFYLLILLLPIQLGKHFWPDWALVGGIRIDYLSPTIYLTDILVIGVLVSWGVDAALKLKIKDQKLKTQIKNSKIFFLILISFFLNIFFSQNKPVAFLKSLKIAELVLLAVYIKNNFSISLFRNFVSLLSFTIIYSSLIAWAQFLKQASIGGLFWWLGERTFTSATPGIAQIIYNGKLLLRPYATFSHPNVLAGYIAVVLPLLIFNFQSRLRKTLNALALVLGMVTLFITFSRAAWVVGGMGIIVSFLLPLFRGGRGFRGRKKLLMIGLLSCYLVILLSFGKERLGQLKFDSESVKLRQELNEVAIQMIKKRPLIGVGLNNFISSLPQFKKGLSFKELQPAHNIYLLVGAEAGLIGLGVFWWLIYLSYRKLLNGSIVKLLKKKYKSKITIWQYSNIAIALTIILLLGLFDHYFYTLQQTQLLFAIVLGMVFGLK